MIVDRGFVYARDLVPLQANGRNRHWLTRARLAGAAQRAGAASGRGAVGGALAAA